MAKSQRGVSMGADTTDEVVTPEELDRMDARNGRVLEPGRSMRPEEMLAERALSADATGDTRRGSNLRLAMAGNTTDWSALVRDAEQYSPEEIEQILMMLRQNGIVI